MMAYCSYVLDTNSLVKTKYQTIHTLVTKILEFFIIVIVLLLHMHSCLHYECRYRLLFWLRLYMHLLGVETALFWHELWKSTLQAEGGLFSNLFWADTEVLQKKLPVSSTTTLIQGWLGRQRCYTLGRKEPSEYRTVRNYFYLQTRQVSYYNELDTTNLELLCAIFTKLDLF